VPVTSTRRFTSLFISPTLPVSRYASGAGVPLPAELPASEPILPDVPLAAGFLVAAPGVPVLPGVDGAAPAPLPVREAPAGDDPDIDEPLLETLVRMNSAPAAPEAAGRDGEPLTFDPLPALVDPWAPPG
jgi:hypothetical protein